MNRNQRYWDSNIFLTVLESDSLHFPKCRGVLEAIEKKEVQIVTSALTLTEVLYLKGHPKITREKSQKIIDFYKVASVVVINLDRKIAEMAREYVWDFDVRPKDAIHLASAIHAKIATFDTFDRDLIKLSMQLGNPPITICEPDIPFQEKLEGIF
jgi:predicted nucleic acid-binding protein